MFGFVSFGRPHYSHFWCREQQHTFRPRLRPPHAPPTPKRRSLIGPDGRTHPCWHTHSYVCSLRHGYQVCRQVFNEIVNFCFAWSQNMSKMRHLIRLHNAVYHLKQPLCWDYACDSLQCCLGRKLNEYTI